MITKWQSKKEKRKKKESCHLSQIDQKKLSSATNQGKKKKSYHLRQIN
jgi:hypothetical protein